MWGSQVKLVNSVAPSGPLFLWSWSMGVPVSCSSHYVVGHHSASQFCTSKKKEIRLIHHKTTARSRYFWLFPFVVLSVLITLARSHKFLCFSSRLEICCYCVVSCAVLLPVYCHQCLPPLLWSPLLQLFSLCRVSFY